MQIDSMQGAYNSLDFTIKTRSGDTISLNMYDNKSMEYSASRDGNTQTRELTLTHAYGYSLNMKAMALMRKMRKR